VTSGGRVKVARSDAAVMQGAIVGAFLPAAERGALKIPTAAQSAMSASPERRSEMEAAVDVVESSALPAPVSYSRTTRRRAPRALGRARSESRLGAHVAKASGCARSICEGAA